MDTTQLIKLNFFKVSIVAVRQFGELGLVWSTDVQNSDGNMHDPITYKVFSPHIHIVFLKNTVSPVCLNSSPLLATASLSRARQN